MNVLALDLGTTTGWAIGARLDGFHTSGTVSFRPQRFEGGGMRYVRFRRWLDDMGHVHGVYFEEVRRHAGVDAAHAYGGFLAHLSAWCEERGIPYQGVPVGTIKKAATGKGNADKAAMIGAAKALGYNVEDDNQADAIHLLRYALAHLVPKQAA